MKNCESKSINSGLLSGNYNQRVNNLPLKWTLLLRKLPTIILKINECSHCDYASVWVSNLRKHLKAHLGEKTHKCQQCDYAFIDAGHLKRHMRNHSGKKSYKCTECNYASVEAYDLKKHSQIMFVFKKEE